MAKLLDKPFDWTKGDRAEIVQDLAMGQRVGIVAEKYGINRKTISRWKQHPDFQAELDRLSLMVGIASKAKRLRIAQRAVDQLVTDAGVKTSADLLSWLKFAQSETDGVKIDIAPFFENALAVAGAGQEGDDATTTDEGSSEPTEA